MRFHGWFFVFVICALAVVCGGTPSSATYARTTLKVIKKVIPDNNPGKFNLRIDGNVRASNVGNNGTTGPVSVQAGSHTVTETAGTATNLGNYTRTFSGDCNSAGVVVIPSGGYKTCIITNKLRKWVTKAAMPTAREYFGVGVIGQNMYVIGGQGGWYAMLERYSPATNTWVTKAPMPTARTGLAVGVINGILYAVGGISAPGGAGGSVVLSKLEAYNPVTNSWTTKAPMPTPREGLAVAVVNGRLYAIGGNSTVFGTALNKVEAYNPVTNTWTTRAPMPTARSWLGVGVLNNKLYAVGGRGGSNLGPKLALVQEYNPMTNTWVSRPSMPTARAGLAVGVANGVLFAIGGYGAGYYAKSEVYDPATNSWFTSIPMLTARAFLGAGVVNGTLYAVGGVKQSGDSKILEAYGP